MEITHKDLLIIRVALAVYGDMLKIEYEEILEAQPDMENGCIDDAVDYFSTEISELQGKIDALMEGGVGNANGE